MCDVMVWKEVCLDNCIWNHFYDVAIKKLFQASITKIIVHFLPFWSSLQVLVSKTVSTLGLFIVV